MTLRVKTIKAVIVARQMFKANPGQKYEMANIWPPESWDYTDFRKWFIKCLNAKINRRTQDTGRKHTDEYQTGLKHDAFIINEHYRSKVIRPGFNILRTPELKRRYPGIDRPPADQTAALGG